MVETFFNKLDDRQYFSLDRQNEIKKILKNGKNVDELKKYIIQELKKIEGIKITIDRNNTCVIATIKFKRTGPKIGFFSNLFGSEEEVSIKNAVFLGILRLITESKTNFTGELKFVFQFALFISTYIPANLKELDEIYSFFLTPYSMSENQILIGAGPVMASNDHFNITVKGKGGHGSAPDKSIDASLIAAYIIQELQSIISRNKAPLDKATFSVTEFKAGEGADNIITDKAYLKGSIKSLSIDERSIFFKRIDEIIKNVCLSLNASYELNFEEISPVLVNEKQQVDSFIKIIEENLNEIQLGKIDSSLNTSQIANLLKEIPGMVFFLKSENLVNKEKENILVCLRIFVTVIVNYLGKK